MKWNENFVEKHKLQSVIRKDDISQSMNILRDKVKIHLWDVAVMFSLNLMDIFCVCVKKNLWECFIM